MMGGGFLPDGCEWAAFTLVLLPPSLLVLFLLVGFIRRWNARAVTGCPCCKKPPWALDIHNVCWNCDCEYDKWGNILKEATRPSLDEVDLAPFNVQRKQPNSDDQYHRPDQEITP
jgi:hypothetical protein